jgi:hypothetical protein
MPVPKHHFIVDALNYMSICVNSFKKKPSDLHLTVIRRNCLDKLMYKLIFSGSNPKKKKNPVHIHICAKYSTTAQMEFWEKVNQNYTDWFGPQHFTLYAIPTRSACSIKRRIKESEVSFTQRKHAVESPDDYAVIALYNYYIRAAAAPPKKKIDPPDSRSLEWTKQQKRQNKGKMASARSAVLSVTVISEDKYRDASVIVDEISRLLLSCTIAIKFAPAFKSKKILAFAQRFSPATKQTRGPFTLLIPSGKIKKSWIPREDSVQ